MSVFEEKYEQYKTAIHKYSWKYKGIHGAELEDLFQEGVLGLHYAVQNFDPTRGKMGELCYYAMCIKGSMRNYLYNVRLITRGLGGRGVAIYPEEINEKTINGFTIDPPQFCIADDVEYGLECLSERERLVIQLSYFEDISFVEIADTLGTSRQNVSQIEKRALKKMKAKLS